jgi:hypothetical protein
MHVIRLRGQPLGEAMAAPGNPKRKKPAANEKIKIKPKTAATPAKIKERAKSKSQESLTEAQKALRSAQAKTKGQARIKAKKDLTQAREELVAARLEIEKEHHGKLRRVSFVVRLTVDKHNQFRRTEIEHVESSRKQNFLSLDGDRLVAFIKTCISPTIIPDPAIPAAPSSEKVEAMDSIPQPQRPKFSLIVSDVRVSHPGDPYFMTLILIRKEPFVAQAWFQLQGIEVPSLTAQEPSYEMEVYANEVTSGKSQLLTTYSAKLVRDVLQYLAPAEIPGLPPGFYRLFTLVTLSKPLKVAGYYHGPVVQVI